MTVKSILAQFIEDPYASGRFENLGCQGIPEGIYNELLRVAADKSVSIYYLAAIYKCGQADASIEIDCPLCGVAVKPVSSATLSIASWQHINWTCPQMKDKL